LEYKKYALESATGNSLCSYLKEAKMPFFYFCFYKIREQESGTGPVGRAGGLLWECLVPVGDGRKWRKDVDG
jgi:hypothetical protein